MGGRWVPNQKWCLQIEHQKAPGFVLWIQVGRVWARMVKELKFDSLQNFSDILALSFWWNKKI